MKDREKFTFLIEHLDPLAQGVDKTSDKITFIPKTLPDETGIAEVRSSVKGVRFARLVELSKTSGLRVKPECPHFDLCSGCDFLHTDYENEMVFKEQSLKKIFQRFPNAQIEIIKAPRRLEYRNRIQLHYNKKAQKLGFLESKSKRIVEVPNCKIALPEVKEQLDKLYQNQQWLKLAKKEKNNGHVEIYKQDNEVKVTWNSHYSDGGFTQVFNEMNNILKSLVSEYSKKFFEQDTTVFDLFSGNGNLVKDIENQFSIYHFDSFDHKIENFFYVDLFKENNLENYKNLIKSECNFIIDPPRSGFKNISTWLDTFKPKHFIYISCNAATLNRDLLSIADDYQVKELKLLDLFPSTKHFESFALCSKN